MGPRDLLRSTAVAACIVLAATPPVAVAAPVSAAAAAVQVRVGDAKGFSRIEFVGARKVLPRLDGQTLVLTVPGAGAPDLVRLKTDPPQFVDSVTSETQGSTLQLRLTLKDGVNFKLGSADGAIFVNLFADPDAKGQPTAVTTSARPDPRPTGGVVHMGVENSPSQLTLRFPWALPTGAAVFRRADAVWIVFDTPVKLDLAKAPKTREFFRALRVVQGEGFTAIRLTAPDIPVFASSEGATWNVTLGPGAPPSTTAVPVSRQIDKGPPSLVAAVAGTTKVVWISDPVVGDKIAAVTALGPAKGVPGRREFVDMALLPSMQGLGVEPVASDVVISADTDTVTIGRPRGLTLTNVAAHAQGVDSGLPQPASMPAVVDFANWSKVGSGGFLSRYDALQEAAAEEVDQEAKGQKSPGVPARMGLARFLVGSQLAFEGIGVLNLIAKTHPEMLDSPEFRGLRGAARVMAGRYKEGQADLSAPALAFETSAALWRGYADSKVGQWKDALDNFSKGGAALNQFSPTWQARFSQATAEAALKMGDLQTARSAVINAVANSTSDPYDMLRSRLLQARLLQALGANDRALAIYDAVARAPSDELYTKATLYGTQLRLQAGQIQPAKAAAIFESLRYRWRGDSSELEVIRSLGNLYLAQGRYRQALDVLRSAGDQMPGDPVAVQIQADLQNAFRALFLEGRADGLEPVQALALFYDFRDLTPVGADGDLMVRRLARRLVDVDLLEQAADLLKYQVDNRLDGVPQAQVATDLATIDLMDRKPEKALDAINATRTTILPQALAQQRRLVEARAWLALNRVDHALELIGRDDSPDAQDLRAEIAWRQKDWPTAGAAYEKALGEGWNSPLPLAPDQETKLLRASIAYSLANDGPALDRLRSRWGALASEARQADALRVALAPLDGGVASPATFTRLVAQDDAFAGWVAKMKQRFREAPAPVSNGKPKVAAASGAPAAG